jgi:hypothetical protein
MSVGPDATCGARRLYRAECVRREARTGPAAVDQVEKLLLIGIRRGRWARGRSRDICVRSDYNALYVQSEARERPSVAVGKGDIDNVSSRAGGDVAQRIGRIRRRCDRDRADRQSIHRYPGLRDEQAPTGIALSNDANLVGAILRRWEIDAAVDVAGTIQADGSAPDRSIG